MENTVSWSFEGEKTMENTTGENTMENITPWWSFEGENTMENITPLWSFEGENTIENITPKLSFEGETTIDNNTTSWGEKTMENTTASRSFEGETTMDNTTPPGSCFEGEKQLDPAMSFYIDPSIPSTSNCPVVTESHNVEESKCLASRANVRTYKKDTTDPRKGVRWTHEEHRLFLEGLERFGNGAWKKISQQCVKSKTPSQVSSHAQKFFIRNDAEKTKSKRRKSIHDLDINDQPTASQDVSLD